MKRTADGQIKKEKSNQIFSNYLSRNVEFLMMDYLEQTSVDSDYQTYSEPTHTAKIKLRIKEVEKGSPNLFITVESTETNYYEQIFNIVIYQYSNLYSPGVVLEMQSGETKEVEFHPVGIDGKPGKNWLTGEIWIQLWKQDSEEKEEEIKKCVEFTDSVIFTADGKQKFWANINFLAVSSPVIYNMIRDLQKQYNHDSPLDLTKLFRGFEDHEIHMYLCFIYNPYCTPVELKQILSLLKISIKLDNQGLIKRILATDNLGKIVKEQTILSNEKSPCHVQNVLNFAKQHDFHKLMVFCSLEILNERSGRRGEMAPYIDIYVENMFI